MHDLDRESIASAKSRGFLRNRGTDCFSGRVVSAGGVFTFEQLQAIAKCAEQCGNGNVAMTTRLCAEIVGIPYDKLDEAVGIIEQSGLVIGGTGARIRPVTACKGTTCVFGCSDTQGLAGELHNLFYTGWRDITLPHKFKIAVGGCPNSCMKPSLNDFGLEAGRNKGDVLYKVFVGGMWGRKTRTGNELSQRVTHDEIFPLLEKVLNWYRDNAEKGERFGIAIDRLGIDSLERFITE